MKNNFYQLTLFVILALLTGSFTLHGQDDNMVGRELGLRFSGLNDFDFISKKETGPDKFRRFRVGFANFDYLHSEERKEYNINAGLAIGTEKRRPVAEKLMFVHGFEALSNVGFNSRNILGAKTKQVFLSPGVGIVLGFQYNISDKFYLSIEAIPSISASYSFQEEPQPDVFRVMGTFNSNSIALSLVYHFSTDKK